MCNKDLRIAIEKRLILKGYNVKGRKVFKTVAGKENSSFKSIKDSIGVDLIIELISYTPVYDLYTMRYNQNTKTMFDYKDPAESALILKLNESFGLLRVER